MVFCCEYCEIFFFIVFSDVSWLFFGLKLLFVCVIYIYFFVFVCDNYNSFVEVNVVRNKNVKIVIEILL